MGFVRDTKYLRKNKSGQKDNLSFRNLPKYVLVDEERIITKLSPILSGQVIEKTKDISLFKLIVTGQDDSTINASKDHKTRKGLDTGRQEVLEALIQDAQRRIGTNPKTRDELLLELSKIEEDLISNTTIIRGVSDKIQEQQQRRQSLWDTRQKLEARAEQVATFIERFTLLDAHYDADIARLMSTQESGRLLIQLSEEACPLCGAEPSNHKHDGLLKSEDVAALSDACEAEQKKLQILKVDLGQTLAKLKDEDNSLSAGVRRIDDEISKVQTVLFEELQPQVTVSREYLDSLLKRRRECESTLTVLDELQRLEDVRSTFESKGASETKAAKDSAKQGFVTTPTQATSELANIIEEILSSWNYPNLARVAFDNATQDIVINGKERAAHGKGYRAIAYSAFLVGVMIFCRRKELPHPGFIILDSPLVTYRKPDDDEPATGDGDFLDQGMVPAFYSHLSKLPDDCQVIIIENEEPPIHVRDSATYTHFTRNPAVGREGFLHSEQLVEFTDSREAR